MRFHICRKVSAIAYAAALFTISTLGTQAQPSISLPTQSTIQVTKEVISTPSDEDKDWKITKIEIKSVFDEITKQTVILQTIYRESPPGYKSPSARRPCNAITELTETALSQGSNPQIATATCTYISGVSTEQAAKMSNIVAHVKHYADKYQSSMGFDLYQPTMLEIWWTRDDNSSYNFSSYQAQWGCNGCHKCDNSSFNYVYTDSGAPPGWNGNRTYTIRYTAPTWPQLQPFPDFGAFVVGINTTNVTGGQIVVGANWPY